MTSNEKSFKYDPTEQIAALLDTTSGIVARLNALERLAKTLERLALYVKIIAGVMVVGLILGLLALIRMLSISFP